MSHERVTTPLGRLITMQSAYLADVVQDGIEAKEVVIVGDDNQQTTHELGCMMWVQPIGSGGGMLYLDQETIRNLRRELKKFLK